jgi:hypothetical protein
MGLSTDSMSRRFSQYGGADWPEAVGFGRQPFTSLTCGPYAPVAGPLGLAIGAFCWLDPDTGIATNVQSEGALLGFTLPLANRHNLWERIYTQYPIEGVPPFPQEIIRPGVGCVIAQSGVFSPKFPDGGQAGTQVFADPSTGLPYSGNPGSYIATPWTLMQNGGPGAKLCMSTFATRFPCYF